MRRIVILFIALLLVFALFINGAVAGHVILCASTTSTQNSGLFDYLLPLFEQKTGIHVKVIAVGTGAALQIGKRGDVDVVFVHSRQDELDMVEKGWFINRHDVMYNDFIIAGHEDDPAGLKGTDKAWIAFKNIAASGALFVSRGDDSGTHKKERMLWNATGIDPAGQKWYLEVGQGMAKTLRIAAEKRAYTLTDKGTFLSLKDRENMDLMILVERDPDLFNQYGVMVVNPSRHPHVRYKEAMKFVEWLVSEEGQGAIAAFRNAGGEQLFYPNAR